MKTIISVAVSLFLVSIFSCKKEKVEEELPPEKKKEMVNAAYKSSSALERVINDILIAAEIDSEKFEVRPKVVDIIPIIEQVIEDLSLKAEKKTTELPGFSKVPVFLGISKR